MTSVGLISCVIRLPGGAGLCRRCLRLPQVRLHSKCHAPGGEEARPGREGRRVAVFVGDSQNAEAASRDFGGSSGTESIRKETASPEA